MALSSRGSTSVPHSSAVRPTSLPSTENTASPTTSPAKTGAAKGFVYIYLAAQLLLLLAGISGGKWQWLSGESLSQTKLAAWLLSIKLS